MNDKYDLVGYRIRLSRKRKHMTMKELGKLVGLHESSISRYEKGDLESLNIDNIKQFASVLGVSPAYLLGWSDIPYGNDEQIKRWMDEVGYVEFSDDEMTDLIDYAKYIISKRKNGASK